MGKYTFDVHFMSIILLQKSVTKLKKLKKKLRNYNIFVYVN